MRPNILPTLGTVTTTLGARSVPRRFDHLVGSRLTTRVMSTSSSGRRRGPLSTRGDPRDTTVTAAAIAHESSSRTRPLRRCLVTILLVPGAALIPFGGDLGGVGEQKPGHGICDRLIGMPHHLASVLTLCTNKFDLDIH